MDTVALTLICLSAVDLILGDRPLHYETPAEYTNLCMQGISHKSAPEKEADLFDKCTPWKDRSCCTAALSEQMHINETWYKINWNHCPNKPLSSACRGRFVQDLCFYECSPNVGPWLVMVEGMKIRKERFVDVPLCETECNGWFEDCKYDFTCIDNWSRGFDWSSGMPQCPENSQCSTIEETFGTAKNFCEKVWDRSWKVVPDNADEGCMLTWWNGEKNPNDLVALTKAKQITSSSCQPAGLGVLNSLLIFSFAWFLVKKCF